MRSRIVGLFAFVCLAWGLALIRASQLQLFPNERLQALFEKQFQTTITLNSRRGAILDRQGRELAISQTAYSLYADPKIIDKPKTAAKKLAKILGLRFEPLYLKLKDNERRFIWIARQLSRDRFEKIKALNLRGLAFVEEYKRVYPNESLLAHTLGLVGSESKGLEGIELQYEDLLTRNKKKLNVPRDARGRPLILDGLAFAENPEGVELTLTVDAEIQHELESELAKAHKATEADQTFGLVLDAKTSAIIAVAATPTFDPNEALKTPAAIRRNRSITDSFEPGSTLKTFALAAALRQGLVAPNKKYNTENGSFRIGDRIIREAELDHRWPSLTVSEILAFSSNIGTAKIALELGAQDLRSSLLDFGFGSRAGIDLPGEAKGIVQSLPWNQHLLANVSFGQGIAVTPLQLANAYAVIANGGMLNQPYIVQGTRDVNSGEIKEFFSRPLRRVLSPELAANLRMMLAGATAVGSTGAKARVEGFVVAGKTGTAQKVNPDGRGYLPNAYISSFAGFIPANDPRFVILIAVDHPKTNSYYGSQVAAPIFARIASYAVRKEGLAPMSLSERNLVPALRELSHKRSLASLPGPDPAKGEEAGPGEARENPAYKTVPNLIQLSMRQALQKTAGAGIPAFFIGQGSVVETDPVAGSPLDPGSSVKVFLR